MVSELIFLHYLTEFLRKLLRKVLKYSNCGSVSKKLPSDSFFFQFKVIQIETALEVLLLENTI